jgi:hypothetical protein
MSSRDVRSPSLTVMVRTYAPGALNRACVLREFGALKTTAAELVVHW